MVMECQYGPRRRGAKPDPNNQQSYLGKIILILHVLKKMPPWNKIPFDYISSLCQRGDSIAIHKSNRKVSENMRIPMEFPGPNFHL